MIFRIGKSDNLRSINIRLLYESIQEELMSFFALHKEKLYHRAGGHCECSLNICRHHPPGLRCNRYISASRFRIYHRSTERNYNLINSIALCAECYEIQLSCEKRLRVIGDWKLTIIRIIRYEISRYSLYFKRFNYYYVYFPRSGHMVLENQWSGQIIKRTEQSTEVVYLWPVLKAK